MAEKDLAIVMVIDDDENSSVMKYFDKIFISTPATN